MSNKLKYSLIISFLFMFNFGFAQNEDGNLGEQTLIIYNEYTPVLKDANRLQFLPQIVDTIKVNPDFEYNVNPTIFKTSFEPTQINAASVKGEPLKRLSNGMVKLGIGNYLSPFVEVYYNSKRQRHYSVGAFVNHHSAHGSMKNTADQKIYGGFNNSLVKVYGKKFYRNTTLTGDLNFSSNQVFFYGYNPSIIVDAGVVKPRDKAEMDMQRYNRLKANVGFVSNNSSSRKLDYNTLLSYQYFFAFTNDYQHKIDYKLDVSKLMKNNRFGMSARLVFNTNNLNSIQSNETFLDLDPYFKHYTDDWQIKLGVATTGEFGGVKTVYHVYPDVHIQHNISDAIIPYAGFKGYIQNNNFEFVNTVNPFISTNSKYQVTNFAQVVDIGVKGNISKNLYFHVNGNYSKIDNMGFFVNDTSLDLNNKFILEYTNVERFSGYGEFALRNMGKFSFTLKGHYYYYAYIKNREKAWHLPSVDVSLKTNYQFDDKLNFGIDLGFVGARYAKEYDVAGDIVETKLNPIIDVNIFAEYSVASNFSTFVHLNNVTGQKQYYWNNYMSQGFNVMLGLKYLF